MNPNPLVSIVIPTHNRPEMVSRSVLSALNQTIGDLEVIVVLDGPDDSTVAALNAISDPRLWVVVRETSGGAANARNTGVALSRGEWIAFLDDDDEWLDTKLEMQLKRIKSATKQQPIITCRVLVSSRSGLKICPRIILARDQPVSEYLLDRTGLYRTEGLISTITILARRSLLLEVPFKKDLRRHQDWDWVLRVSSRPDVEILFCPETLAIVHVEHEDSVSRKPDWEFSRAWARSMKSHLTARAYASFITSHVAWQAATQHAWGAFVPLLRDAVRTGALRPLDFLRYTGFWLIPRNVRHYIGAPINRGSQCHN